MRRTSTRRRDQYWRYEMERESALNSRRQSQFVQRLALRAAITPDKYASGAVAPMRPNRPLFASTMSLFMARRTHGDKVFGTFGSLALVGPMVNLKFPPSSAVFAKAPSSI